MQGVGVMTQQTRYFIEQNPTDLVLTRNAKVADGAGGTTTTPTTLSAQVMRVVRADENSGIERQDAAGRVVRPDLNVVAMPDGDIGIGDTFTWTGLNVEVVWVTDLGYEIIAEAAVR